ncbi:MAG: hypothetical protein M3Q69_16790 [Acidobacteriota bacterium]|nr:hypothetical protein [Acidobacteriota bacterium]
MQHVRTTLPNGVAQYNGYRKDGFLTSKTFSTLALNRELGATYVRDQFGSMTARLTATEDGRWTYGYDVDGRLTEYPREQLGTVLGCDPSPAARASAGPPTASASSQPVSSRQ